MRARRPAAALAVALGATLAPIVVTASVPAAAIDVDPVVVIGQLYGGGGNTGAPFTNDFVELFNRSDTTQVLTGWSVQYASATGSGFFSQNSPVTVNATIPPGGHFLVQLSGGANGVPLPTPDATGAINMSASAGKVVLVDQTAGLLCNGSAAQPCSADDLAHIRDLVGYGSANFAETLPAPTLTNATAAMRVGARCTDTNDNSSDFAAGTPVPQNSAAPATPCGPPDNVPPTVTAPTSLTTTQGTPASAPISASDSDGTVVSLAVTSPASLPSGVTYTPTGPADGTLAIDATAVAQTVTVTFTATDDDGDTGTATTVVTVNDSGVCGADATEIAAIQGSGATSPLVGQVRTIEGVVTGDFQAPGRVGGFYLQDDTPDADPATSDGILVFDNASAVARDERVRVTGRVTEFRRGSDLLSDTVTELTSTSAVTGCGLGTIAAAPLVLPFATLDARESLEGVLVEVPAGLTATELFTWARFGEVAVSSGGRLFSPTNGQGGTAEENDRRRILLDDSRSTQNPTTLPYLREGRTIPRLGDTLAEAVTGVLTYEFDQYRVQPIEDVDVVDTVLFDGASPRPLAPDEVGGDLRISTFNTLNYFVTLDTAADQGAPGLADEPRGADTVAELTRQRDKLIPAIVGLDADVLGLIEIENSSAGALADLVARVNAAQPDPDDDYAIVAEPDLGFTPNAYGGAFGTDLIKVAIAYRPAVVTPIGSAVSSADPVHNRPPLAQTFELAGGSEPFTMVMNHFKSKGSCPAPGTDPPNDDLGQGCWNALRLGQAQAVLDLLETAALPNPILLGDLNSYGEEDPVHLIEEAGYTNVSEALIPLADRYSFVFEGEAGELDHALVGGDLADRVTGADIWHINSDEPAGIDYQDFNVNQAIDGDPIYSPDPFRSSDHDPLVFGLDLNEAPSAPTGVTAEAGWAAATARWGPPADDGGTPVTGYLVRVLQGGQVIQTVLAGPGATSAALGPLTIGSTYDIEIVATNAVGDSPAATATVVPGGRPSGWHNLRSSGICAAGQVTFTITNPNGVAAGVTWVAPKPGLSGSVAVGPGAAATVTVPAVGGGTQTLELAIAGTGQPAGKVRC